MDHWRPRRSRSTSSFPRRRGSRRPSSPEFERARFKRSPDSFESYEKEEWPVRNKSGYRERSRSPLSDHDSFRGRSDRGRPFRGRSDMGRPFRGRSDRGRPFVERPYRGRPDRGGSERGRPFRGGSDRGRPFRGGSDRGRPFRGGSDRGRPFRGGSDRGRPFRGRSDRGRTFRGRPFIERPHRGRPDRERHYRERSCSRESYHSFQENSRNRQSKSRSRSNSRDRYYVIKPGNERYSDEEFIHSRMSRSRSNSGDRLYLENERHSDDDSFGRANDRPRVSKSRSNSRGRLYPIDSDENRESYFQSEFQPRKSRSRSNSRDRLHSTGHKVYYNRSFEIQNDYQPRKSRSRSNSGDRLYPTGSIKIKRYIDEEYEGQSKYKPREFRSRSNSRDRLSPSEAVGYNRNEPRIEIPSVYKLKEPRIPSYNYSSTQNLSLKDGRFKEEGVYSQSKPDTSYTIRANFNQDASHERKCFIEDKVYDSKPKVYRLSSTFDHDLNEKPSQYKNYPSARVVETKPEHQRDFPSSFQNTNSPSYPQRYFDTNKEYYERKIKTEHTAVSTDGFDDQNRFTSQKRGFQEDDEFQASKKRSYQDSFPKSFDQVGSSQHTTDPQNRFSNKLFPRKYQKFESDDNEDKPSFKNRSWHREGVKNKNSAPQEDLSDLSQVIIFFDFTSNSIMRSLWAVLFSSFRRCDLWLNCIENCYQDDYKNM